MMSTASPTSKTKGTVHCTQPNITRFTQDQIQPSNTSRSELTEQSTTQEEGLDRLAIPFKSTKDEVNEWLANFSGGFFSELTAIFGGCDAQQLYSRVTRKLVVLTEDKHVQCVLAILYHTLHPPQLGL